MSTHHTVARKGSLASQVTLLSAVVVSLVAALAVGGWWVTRAVAGESAAVIAAIAEIGDHAVDLAMKGESMRLHVVQVQQFLTDAAATRAGDGLAEAETHARAFRDLLATLRDHYRQEGRGDQVQRLDRLDGAFDTYYREGQEMARAYIDGGPSRGNPLMPAFDAAAGALSRELDPLVADQITVMEESLATARRAAVQVAAGVVRLRLLGSVTILIVGTMVLLLRRTVQRRVLTPISGRSRFSPGSREAVAHGHRHLASPTLLPVSLLRAHNHPYLVAESSTCCKYACGLGLAGRPPLKVVCTLS